MSDAQEMHPSLEQLSAFDSGELRDAEWDEVERHVAHCARCCDELDALPQDPFASLLRSSAGSTTPPPATTQSTSSSAGSLNPISAATAPNPGGTIIYYRME